MRQLLLVGVLLSAASSPARDARTTFTVGAYVVESCEVSTEVSTAVSRSDARCAAAASREPRVAAPLQATVSSESAVRGESARPVATAGPREASSAGPREASTAGPREARTIATRILLIRF